VATPFSDEEMDAVGEELGESARGAAVAELYLFLASDEARFINGAVLVDRKTALKAGQELTRRNVNEERAP
jgi:NAD(P)-dependent dehydrogenase (short-subunit alcohol dehydrogenase family)